MKGKKKSRLCKKDEISISVFNTFQSANIEFPAQNLALKYKFQIEMQVIKLIC